MKKRLLILILIAGVLFTSCETLRASVLPASSNTGGQVSSLMLINPYDGEHLLLGEMCDVKSEASNINRVQAVSLLVNNSIYRHDVFSEISTSADVYQPWTPKEPGTYTLQTILEDSAGVQISSNTITVYVGDAPEEPDVEIAETSDTEEECPDPIATTHSYANCRSGPGTAYNILVGLKPDQSFPILAHSASGNWWMVERNTSGAACWIWIKNANICGDIDDVKTDYMEEKDEVQEQEEAPEKPAEEPAEEPEIEPTKDGPTTI